MNRRCKEIDLGKRNQQMYEKMKTVKRKKGWKAEN